jgi:histidyl-tRNA synthetase
VGFALGVDRIVLASEKPPGSHVDVYLISEAGAEDALVASSSLRMAGLRVDFDTEGRKVEAQFKSASRIEARAVVVLKAQGDEVDVRIGDERAQMPLASVPEWLRDRL